jgi:hypothetical protein
MNSLEKVDHVLLRRSVGQSPQFDTLVDIFIGDTISTADVVRIFGLIERVIFLLVSLDKLDVPLSKILLMTIV